ncbi:ABC transporter C family member 10-like [Corylus avellana]|uniref:ABC transporter C family member 10-like n=1 Tax=Corylus avellana TaxID=13451 RepID=UPI001E22A1E7|nr:ABC transporter C family member 10-like [Corylus avellana]
MKVERDSVGLVTPFAKAGFVSRMSFWWLNPLMKKGRKKTLEDVDIPKLREADRAENCYMLFLEQLNKQKRAKPSILKAIILCHWKEIILTGCFALLKILTASAGPLLLNSFILVGEGKKSFKYEGHLLAISFLFIKSIESISQRQWFFRSRLIGLKVRSLLIAAIYKKQLRLTNSARLKHSAGEIMNYRYYFASAKELMRINGTTKSLVASHLAESLAGAMTIRAFEKEDKFFAKNLDLIDTNASPSFHNFSANEWLTQWIEMISAVVLASAALCMVLLPPRTFSFGLMGMSLSYGLSLSNNLVRAIQMHCSIANDIISVERLYQYMHIPSEAPQVIEGSRPMTYWPAVGKVEIQDLQVRYRPSAPLVLCGINCTFEGGHKIGIVGRTGSGKTTLISALFRLVEPAAGKIIVDGIDISQIGLHDLRSRLGIIPQDPTLFNGNVRYNLDPLSQYSDQEIWEVIEKCQLQETLQDKGKGLEALVVEDGSNWSVGQRQLFCLGRVLLRKSRILVLDEATASIDNATDTILQKTIRTEFADCTVIIVAHRIPTVMDCNMVLAISDGKVMEYDAPRNLMKREDSLFGQLVKEYWSRSESTKPH